MRRVSQFPLCVSTMLNWLTWTRSHDTVSRGRISPLQTSLLIWMNACAVVRLVALGVFVKLYNNLQWYFSALVVMALHVSAGGLMPREPRLQLLNFSGTILISDEHRTRRQAKVGFGEVRDYFASMYLRLSVLVWFSILYSFTWDILF